MRVGQRLMQRCRKIFLNGREREASAYVLIYILDWDFFLDTRKSFSDTSYIQHVKKHRKNISFFLFWHPWSIYLDYEAGLLQEGICEMDRPYGCLRNSSLFSGKVRNALQFLGRAHACFNEHVKLELLEITFCKVGFYCWSCFFLCVCQ